MSDDTLWPVLFGLGGKSFLEVFNTKKEWVDFTMTEMKDAQGIFKVWRDYCSKKLNITNGAQDEYEVE